MSASLTSLLVWSALLGAGLVAGTFFAFSSFVMPALSARPAPQAIRAMQSINEKVLNVSFLGTFFGTAIVSVALGVMAVAESGDPGALVRLVGGAVYLVGTVGVTVVCNVPRNEALALVDPNAADAEAAWATYDREWTAWNTVRTLAALASTGVFVGSLCMA